MNVFNRQIVPCLRILPLNATFLNLSQLVQEVCLMNHQRGDRKRIKRRQTKAEHYTTLEQPDNHLTYAKYALPEELF